jgi:site-specific DNA recombinase
VLIHEAEEHGTRVEFVTEKLDETPAGRFLRDALAFVAEVEREKTRERTRRGIRARAEAGKIVVGGVPLYGYRYEGEHKDRYVPDDETAPIVQRIFREVADGKTFRQVAQSLNQDEIPTVSQILQRRGILPRNRNAALYWRVSSLFKIVSHPAYMGQHSAFRIQKVHRRDRDEVTGTVKRVKQDVERSLDDGVRLTLPESACPPLVTPEFWYAARASRKRNQLQSKRNNRHPEESLLRGGFVVCGYCGRPMNVKPSRGVPSYYCLNNSSRVEDAAFACPGGHFSCETNIADGIVWSAVSELLLEPQRLQLALVSTYLAAHKRLNSMMLP